MVALAGSVAVMRWVYLQHAPTTDLRIYRDATLAFVHGHDAYRTGYGSDHHYRFTYPPLALLVFSPSALVSLVTARIVTWALSAVALVAVVGRSLTTTSAGWRTYRWPATLAISGAALWAEPVRATLFLGQINLVLLALAWYDCLAPRTRIPRGVALGVASAVKLTPGIFVVYLALTGRRRAALTAAGVAAGLAGLAFAIAPGQSWEYWTHDVFDAHRVGRTTYVANQSLRGALGRVFLTLDPSALMWLVLVAVVAAGGLAVAVRAHRAGDVLNGLCACAVTGLLVSPISWNHHWVVAVPVTIALVAAARDAAGWSAGGLAVAGVWGLLFLTGPMWWVAHHDLPLRYHTTGSWQVPLADAYVLGGLLFLVWVAWTSVAGSGSATPVRSVPAAHQ